MTTELELKKQFFDTFGIEKACIDISDGKRCKGRSLNCEDCGFFCYPDIDDRILLELITYLADAFVGNYCIPDVDYINLESNILSDCIKYSNKGYLKEQVQALLKEE